VIPPTGLNVTTAESFNLMCNTSGYPVPSISWTHNGTAVNESDRIRIIPENSTRAFVSVLNISSATASDSGEYTCTVSSLNFQTVSSRPVTVLIQGRYTQMMQTVCSGSINGLAQCYEFPLWLMNS